MQAKKNGRRLVALEINMLLDISSLHFVGAKNYIFNKTGVSLPVCGLSCLDNAGYLEGTSKLLNQFCSQQSLDAVKVSTDIEEEFGPYKKTIKPKLLAFWIVEQLISSGAKVLAYSHYEKEFNSFLKTELMPKLYAIPLIPLSILPSYLALALITGISCTIFTNGDLAEILSHSSFLSKSN